MNRLLARPIALWLPRAGLRRSVTLLVGGTALAQAVAIAASPLLTRLYTPSDFGTLQVFNSLLGLVLVFAAGRYDVAILLPHDVQSAVDTMGVALLCVALSATATTIIAITCHYHWLLPDSMLPLKGRLWLLPLSVIGAGLYQVLNSWAMRCGHYRQIATTKLIQIGAQLITQLGFGLVTRGSSGLLVGDAVGRVMGSGRFTADFWSGYASQFRAIRLSQMVTIAHLYRRYPLVSMWSALINTSGFALPFLFFSGYYGANNTGSYALVNRVLGVPGVLIGLSISQVYTAEAAKLFRADPQRLMYIFIKTTRHMIYLGLGPCVLFTLFAPWLFKVIFGPAWREAGGYARDLAFMFYAGIINSPFSMTLNILQKHRTQLVWDSCRLILTVLAISVPHHFGYSAGFALISYGVAMSTMYGVHWTQSYFAIRSCVGTWNCNTLTAGITL